MKDAPAVAAGDVYKIIRPATADDIRHPPSQSSQHRYHPRHHQPGSTPLSTTLRSLRLKNGIRELSLQEPVAPAA